MQLADNNILFIIPILDELRYNMRMDRIYSFAPVYAPDARLLILGTMPSVESLKARFYYAHPRNCFWPMIADLLNEPVAAGVEDKKAMLIRNRIALWDVAHSCVREGSLDSAIVEPLPNDVASLLRQCPSIDKILFNGGTAKRLFERLLPGVGRNMARHIMPSTSPAYTLSYEYKRAQWAEQIIARDRRD